MKSAIYIEDGAVQFVLTPESEYEKRFVESLKGKEYKLSVSENEFHRTVGNFVKQSPGHSLIFTAMESPYVPTVCGGR